VFLISAISCKGKNGKTKNRVVCDKITRGKRKKPGTRDAMSRIPDGKRDVISFLVWGLFPRDEENLEFGENKKDRPAGR
jgi:hypothetical protein